MINLLRIISLQSPDKISDFQNQAFMNNKPIFMVNTMEKISILHCMEQKI